MRIPRPAFFVYLAALLSFVIAPSFVSAQTVLSGLEGSVELGRYTAATWKSSAAMSAN